MAPCPLRYHPLPPPPLPSVTLCLFYHLTLSLQHPRPKVHLYGHDLTQGTPFRSLPLFVNSPYSSPNDPDNLIHGAAGYSSHLAEDPSSLASTWKALATATLSPAYRHSSITYLLPDRLPGSARDTPNASFLGPAIGPSQGLPHGDGA